MKKIILVMVIAFLLAVLAGGPPAEAGATKTAFDVYAVACVLDPGLVWTTGKDDKVVHVRGQVNYEVLFDATSFEAVGENTVIVNVDLNQQSGSGGVSASFSGLFDFVSSTDAVIGMVAGHFTDFLFAGRISGRGTGDSQRVKVKGQLQSVTTLPPELLPLLPCPPAQIAGVFRDKSVIIDTR